MNLKSKLATLSVLFLALSVEAVTRYVDVNNLAPVSPFTNWTTAATDIQSAINVATNGDLILVTNGVYQTGGQLITGSLLTNRVAVTRALTIRSVNGPDVTVIAGHQAVGITNGNTAVRGVYLTNGAFLSGFTVTSGATRTNGGAIDVRGGGIWCVSTNASISNCVIVANAAFTGGGGIVQGRVIDSMITRNCAPFGGGASSNLLNNCVLDHNAATDGGGAHQAILRNCTLSGNFASRNGGGVYLSTLNVCVVTGNSAYSGGGAYSATLSNCTVTGNSAVFSGGGVSGGTMESSIIYFNTAISGLNFSGGTFNYCCTLPLPSGSHNLASDPRLASSSHLSASSPCRGAGNVTNSTEIDGEAWLSPPSIGCDEYRVGSVTGILSVSLIAAYTNVATGFPVPFTAAIGGKTSGSQWDFGDGTIVSNQPYASHVWTNVGDFTVVLSAFNESQSDGVNASVVIHVLPQPVHYVAITNTTPSPPYDSWATAATNIQDAVDAATTAGALILVNDGVYQSGGRAVYATMTNRLVVDKPLRVQSVNGPQFTSIQGRQVPPYRNGSGAIRCVYLAGNSSLSGFTLGNGGTETAGTTDNQIENGGGVWCASADVLVTNCVLSDNSASWHGGAGFSGNFVDCTLTNNNSILGGASYLGTFNNCTLVNNSSTSEGGGAYQGSFTNCLLAGNSSHLGGGTSSGLFSHCTFSSNSASLHGGGTFGGIFYDCNFFGNSAPIGAGGATEDGALYRCTLIGNLAAGGGGADSATLYECVVAGNVAAGQGGGTLYTTMNDCTVVSNSAAYSGGGAYFGGGANNILYFNSAPDSPNFYQGVPGGPSGGAFTKCCTTPIPELGDMNITNVPLFVDIDTGDFHLASNSPCINAGYQNGFTLTDRDGNPRVVGGTVDIGAYEFQTPASVLSYAWAQQFGLPVDGSADYVDTDGDGMNNWQEWRANTVPTDPGSVLAMLSVFNGPTMTTLRWQSVSNMTYYLQYSTNLQDFTLLDIIPSQGATTGYSVSNSLSPVFFRVGVK